MELTINLDSANLSVGSKDNISFYHADIMMHFIGVDIQRSVDGFRFTYLVEDSAGVVYEFDGDLSNISSVMSKWNGLHVLDRIHDLLPNTDYTLSINCQWNSQTLAVSTNFKTELPPRPFPSWEWNQTTLSWNPPIPHPEDGMNYIWDEGALDWVLVEEIALEGSSATIS